MRSRYAHNSTQRAMTRNILALYMQATESERTLGLAWYPTAIHGCNVWAEQLGISPLTVAAVIAALSPQCEWTRNLIAALALLRGEVVPYGPIRANLHKARRIHVDGALSVDGYFREGPKVRAFCRNLSGDGHSVTVDTHASQAALNDVQATPGVGHTSAYVHFVTAYQCAAETAQLRPCDMQAVVWHIWKRLHPRSEKRNLRRQWDAVGEF